MKKIFVFCLLACAIAFVMYYRNKSAHYYGDPSADPYRNMNPLLRTTDQTEYGDEDIYFATRLDPNIYCTVFFINPAGDTLDFTTQRHGIMTIVIPRSFVQDGVYTIIVAPDDKRFDQLWFYKTLSELKAIGEPYQLPKGEYYTYHELSLSFTDWHEGNVNGIFKGSRYHDLRTFEEKPFIASMSSSSSQRRNDEMCFMTRLVFQYEKEEGNYFACDISVTNPQEQRLEFKSVQTKFTDGSVIPRTNIIIPCSFVEYEGNYVVTITPIKMNNILEVIKLKLRKNEIMNLKKKFHMPQDEMFPGDYHHILPISAKRWNKMSN